MATNRYLLGHNHVTGAIFNITLVQVKAIVEPDDVDKAIRGAAVTFVSIYAPILLIFNNITCQYHLNRVNWR